MPLGAANRLAKSYVENIFIWNAWPVLYGGFGALLSAVQMGQIGQMLSHNNFLGGLGNLEGSILIGIVSIVYSLAIAIIPFIAKRIVSGDVGSTAAAMVGAAVTAVTAGAAGIEGAAAGVAAARAGSAGAASSGASVGGVVAGSARALPASTGGNQPAPPQRAPIAASSVARSFDLATRPTLEGHAEQIRNSISEAMGADNPATRVAERHRAAEDTAITQVGPSGAAAKSERRLQIIGGRKKRTDCASLQPWDMGRLPCRPDCGEQHRRRPSGRKGVGAHMNTSTVTADEAALRGRSITRWMARCALTQTALGFLPS